MLPRENRLTEKRDFNAVFENGKWLRGSAMSLIIWKTQDKLPPKVGVIVSTKISKKATVRNRIKRAIRAAAEEYVNIFPQGTMALILATKQAAEEEADLTDQAKKLIKKVI